MRAVNLVPAESRRGAGVTSGLSLSPSYALLGLLAVAVLFAVLYVTTGNTVSQRQAQLQSLEAQVASAQAQAASYNRFASFSQLAQQRVATVRQIANTRFDWQAALTNLSRVVPADTSLSAVSATVSPTTSAAGAGASNGLRSYDPGPAFELSGCTKSQDEVAALMSRLRLIDGVTRVTLNDSQKALSATSVASSTGAGGAVGCGPNGPTFDLLVFFAPIPGALPTSTTPGTPGATPAAGSTTTTTTTTSTTPTTTTTTTAQPVSSTNGSTQ